MSRVDDGSHPMAVAESPTNVVRGKAPTRRGRHHLRTRLVICALETAFGVTYEPPSSLTEPPTVRAGPRTDVGWISRTRLVSGRPRYAPSDVRKRSGPRSPSIAIHLQ